MSLQIWLCIVAEKEMYDTVTHVRNHSIYMAKTCAITGKSSQVGGGYSNRTRATQFNPTGKVRKYSNIQKKKIFVPELNKTVTVNISTKCLKTLQKNGAYETLKKAKLI
jgi:large subunit ribosomal protein L28